MTCKSLDCVRFVFFLDRPRFLVIFAWAAFRELSQKQKYIRDSVTEQACKKNSIENNKEKENEEIRNKTREGSRENREERRETREEKR